MRLHSDLPQFLPISGKIIQLPWTTKDVYQLFGTHLRKDCTDIRVQWINKIKAFISNHELISKEFCGKWAKIIEESTTGIQQPWLTMDSPSTAANRMLPSDLSDTDLGGHALTIETRQDIIQ
jgi:hypothetical protein